jgi:hypothetical protein
MLPAHLADNIRKQVLFYLPSGLDRGIGHTASMRPEKNACLTPNQA